MIELPDWTLTFGVEERDGRLTMTCEVSEAGRTLGGGTISASSSLATRYPEVMRAWQRSVTRVAIDDAIHAETML